MSFSVVSAARTLLPSGLGLLGGLLVGQSFVGAQEKLAIQPLSPNLSGEPAELTMVCAATAADYPAGTRFTADTVCQQGLTPPSLWWTQEELASQLKNKKLVNNWIATREVAGEAGKVQLIVNPQAWSLLDYFTRYEFVNSFGLAARDFGYGTEIFDTRGAALASYRCNFVSAEPLIKATGCRIDLGRSQMGFRSSSRRNGLF